MERLEMAEKIAERANITVEEARDVLERNNWDMLDALVELERAGKIGGGAQASTKQEEPEYMTVAPTVAGKEEARAHRKETGRKIKENLKKVIRVLVDNKFVVYSKDREVGRVPVIVPVICALVNVVLTAIALFAGMAFGLRYAVEGEELGTKSVNDGMTKASEYTQNIVNDIAGKRNGVQSDEEQNQ